MCVCGPKSALKYLEGGQQIRVATKYPNIAKDYFYNQKHRTVEIIKLNGSIELAPIVGLSEVIVDIVEGKWSSSFGGNLPSVRAYGSEPCEYENGRREDTQTDRGPEVRVIEIGGRKRENSEIKPRDHCIPLG